jgi:hypothetical protein
MLNSLRVGGRDPMSAAQRVSRGFHRLGLLLAAIPFLIGSVVSVGMALENAGSARQTYVEQTELACAKARLAAVPKKAPDNPDKSDSARPNRPLSDEDIWGSTATNRKPDWGKQIDEAGKQTAPPSAPLPPGWKEVPSSEVSFDDLIPSHDLKALGCSEVSRKVSDRDILDAVAPMDFSYAAALLPDLAVGLGLTLITSLFVYVVVRAIGWVIGGFAAS